MNCKLLLLIYFFANCGQRRGVVSLAPPSPPPLAEYKKGDIFWGFWGGEYEYLPFLRNVFKILKVVKNQRGNDLRCFYFFFPSFSLFGFCRVMWINIHVNPNRMHIFLFKCLGLLYLFSFGGWAGGIATLRLLQFI